MGDAIRQGLEAFRSEVESGTFPDTKFSPYHMSADEEERFHALLGKDADERIASGRAVKQSQLDADEYEIAKLY